MLCLSIVQSTFQQRELVLDYLVHNCFNSTVEAFVSESSVAHVDADGDEVMPAPEKSLTKDSVDLKERMGLGDLRKGMFSYPHPTLILAH